ncbi:hypothetical protein BSKO_12300 [Bryopsis sp. KO-2023]|nr:hypothetical protein BSKO_12300 [Bryopsis sp. KO-2023]
MLRFLVVAAFFAAVRCSWVPFSRRHGSGVHISTKYSIISRPPSQLLAPTTPEDPVLPQTVRFILEAPAPQPVAPQSTPSPDISINPQSIPEQPGTIDAELIAHFDKPSSATTEPDPPLDIPIIGQSIEDELSTEVCVCAFVALRSPRCCDYLLQSCGGPDFSCATAESHCLDLDDGAQELVGISWGTPDHQGRQGGRVIQEFQALQEKLAEMVILVKKVNPAKMDSMGFQEDQVRKVIQVLLASLVLLESQERVDCQVETAKEVRRAKWAPLVHLDYVGRQGRRVKQVVQVHKERRGTQAIQAFKVERVTQESLEALDWVFQERQVVQAPLELQEPQDLLVHRDKMVNKVNQEYPARLVNLGRLGLMVLMEFQAFLEQMEFQGRQGSTGHQVKGAKTCTDS